MQISDAVSGAERAGREVKDHPALDALVRAGLVAYGGVYLLLGWLAIQLVVDDRDGPVNKSHALHELAKQDGGAILLWAAAAGFAALAVWQVLEAWLGHRSKEDGKRLLARAMSVGRAGLYGVLAVSAAKTAAGARTKEDPDGYTRTLMSSTFGQWLVIGVGLVIVGYAVASAAKGLTDRYRRDLDLDGNTGWAGTATTVLARVGYVSRGVAFAIVGGLFVWAGITHDANKSGGLDAALGRLLHAPLGPLALSLVAAGFLCYGTYNLFRARYHAG